MLITQDWRVNRGRPHIQMLLVLFRAAQKYRSSRSRLTRVFLGRSVSIIYRVIGLFLFSFDVPVSTRIGPSLAVHHGMGVVIHSKSILGSNVTLRQLTTIGSNSQGLTPTIDDGVNLGPHTCVIGNVHVGEGAIIGAGSVVVRNVDARTTVAGNPARMLIPKISST